MLHNDTNIRRIKTGNITKFLFLKFLLENRKMLENNQNFSYLKNLFKSWNFITYLEISTFLKIQ